MKIEGNDPRPLKKTKARETREREKTLSETKAQNKESPSIQAEKVLFSSVKDIKKAKEIIAKTPDVRIDKINEIKSRIDNGEYHVTGKAIADKMLKELLI